MLLGCSFLIGTDGLAGSGADGGGGATSADAASGDVEGGRAGTDGGSDGAGGPPTTSGIKLATPAVTSPLVDLNDPDAGASTVVTTTVHQGDLLVAGVAWTYGVLEAAPPALTVSDALGNTWQPATMAYDNYESGPGGHCKADAQIFYATNANGGSDVVTMTTSQAHNTTFTFTLLEYAGAFGSNPVDAFQGQATPPSGSNLISAPPVVLSGTTDVIVAVFIDTAGGGLMTPGAGFVLRGSNAGLYSMVEDDLLPTGASAGTQTASASLPPGATDNCWAAAVAAFTAQPR